MGMLTRLTHKRGGSIENPNLPLNDADIWNDTFGGSGSSTGVRVTHNASLKISAVFRGVNLISTTVGKLPLFVQKRGDDANDKERDKSHPAYNLLRRKPNDYHPALTFRQTLTAHAILRGNGYAYIDRVAGRPVALLPLLPDRTYPVRVDGVQWYITQHAGEQHKIPAVDVLHIRGLGYDGLTGYSVFDLASEDFGLALAQTKYAAVFFKNSATPKLVIEHPGSLGDKGAKNLKKSWEAMQTGLDNAHSTAVLEEGAKVNAFSVSAKDAQLLESRRFDLVSIANWLGLPVHKLGAEGRTAFASLEQENQAFLDESIDPWLCAWETECWDKLLTEREKAAESHDIEFERKALLRTDTAARGEYYQKAVGAPFMTRNETRARENLPPIDGGDELLTPLNMTAVAIPPPPDKKPDPDTPDDDTDDRSAAVRTMAHDVIRRMAKRMLMAAAKDKTIVDDTVTRSLQPLSALCSPFANDNFVEAVCALTKRRIGLTEDHDQAAEQLADDLIAAYFER